MMVEPSALQCGYQFRGCSTRVQDLSCRYSKKKTTTGRTSEVDTGFIIAYFNTYIWGDTTAAGWAVGSQLAMQAVWLIKQLDNSSTKPRAGSKYAGIQGTEAFFKVFLFLGRTWWTFMSKRPRGCLPGGVERPCPVLTPTVGHLGNDIYR